MKTNDLKKITLTRNGCMSARPIERSDMKIGQLVLGERVMLRIKGDCCGSTSYREYVVTGVVRTDRFGGRDTVTFERVTREVSK